ncbi:MAG: ABC transporter permease [Bdellovibrionales bacterium]|nr:ABC transporter permease [Bdellovibrionales bacterium]
MIGFGEDGLSIAHDVCFLVEIFRRLKLCRKSSVCIIGYEIAERLFFDSQPLGQVLWISEGKSLYGCPGKISVWNLNKWGQGLRPNLQVVVPYSFFRLSREIGGLLSSSKSWYKLMKS